MKVNKIYFDMDGVLADFNRGVRELCHIEPHKQLDVDNKALETIRKDVSMWGEISKIDHFYYKLEPIAGAVELFNTLNDKYPGKCEILTGIPRPDKGVLHSGEDKIEWCKKYLPEGVKVHIVYRAEKKNYVGEGVILIDDLQSTIKEWKELGGFGILHKSNEETLRILKENNII